MKSIFYILGIILTAAGAALSFLNWGAHKDLTQKSYETRKENDGLKSEIKHKLGENLKLTNDDGEEVTRDKAGSVIALRKAQAISGLSNPANFNPSANNSAPVIDGAEYKPYNVTLANADTMAEQKEYVEAKAEEKISGANQVKAAEEVTLALSSYISQTLASNIRQVQGDIDLEEGEKESLQAKIKKYQEAEAKIQKMFADEGISTLEGGKEKYEELASVRKERVGEEETLQDEQEDFKKTLTKKNAILENQKEYFAKRKVSLQTNEKKFSVKSVDYAWGFLVVKGDQSTKFFVNQKLMILRGNTFIGYATISAIEPGRVVANIDYKSIKEGMTFRKGDSAILAKPADR